MAVHNGVVLVRGVVSCCHDEHVAQHGEDENLASDELEHFAVVRRFDPLELVEKKAQDREAAQSSSEAIRVGEPPVCQCLLGLCFVLEIDGLLRNALL